MAHREISQKGSPSSVQRFPLRSGSVPGMASSIAPTSTTPGASGTTFDDMEDINPEDIEDMDDMENAESLIGPAMSRQATRLKSPRTPAVEKRNALEEALAYFDEGPNTPPLATDEFLPGPKHNTRREPPAPVYTHTQTRIPEPQREPKHGRGMSLGGSLPSLPTSPTREEPAWPLSPLYAPEPMNFQPHSPSQSSMQVAFRNEEGRKRSMSGGAAALINLLPKGLPSIPHVGNMFGSTTPDHVVQKTKHGVPPSLPEESSGPPTPTRISLSRETTPHAPPQSLGVSSPHSSGRPRVIRRTTSDDSLLYHTLSRSSSLGDDTLFENQRQQVNSRAKAIKDSLQDRSTFRMPNMPSMPSMPTMPSFNFSLNFLNSNDAPTRSRSNTDGASDIMSKTLIKKRPIPISNPAVRSVMTAVAVSAPVAAAEAEQATGDGKVKYLDRAIENLTGDVVIMGGYRGSVLRSTKTNRQVWAPVKVGLNIRKVDLEVGLEPEDEERMQETIYPAGMLQNIGPVDISKRLIKKLSECENSRTGQLRVWDYGYDWRLSPHLLARKLSTFLEKLPCNQPTKDGSKRPGRGALVIAHSLGGLITRHVVNHRPELFSGVIYAGVPQSCINILGPLRNGDAVLLSQRVLTAQVNFTLRTSFVLLPEDGSCFVDINTKEKYPMDFFDVNNWIKYRLSPCIDPPLPPRLSPSGLLGSLNLSASMLSLPIPGKKSSPPVSSTSSTTDLRDRSNEPHHQSKTTRAADVLRDMDFGKDRTIAPQMGNKPMSTTRAHSNSVSMAVTIPRDKAIAYLTRTLAETKKFKQELYFRPELSQSNVYPPLALIYGKSIPTCCGAKVDGLEGIPCSDVYDNLAFAAGDGVTLAKAAMLPEGYKAVYGGRIRSERGHVTLLGDLNAVGKAIEAVQKGRAKGIGLGV